MDKCKYRLPCGWCDRKNEKCEIGVSGKKEICDHVWECCGATTGGFSYICKKCGAVMKETVKG